MQTTSSLFSQRTFLIAATLLATSLTATPLPAQPYPPGSGLIDVTAEPYGADPTGEKDATDALSRALHDGSRENRTVYLPAGTYRVTDTVSQFRFVKADGDRPRIMSQRLLGDGQEKTIIRLADGAFGDERKAVVDFIRMSGLKGEAAGDGFATEVEQLTIDVGKDNPGATGLVYTGSNTGAVRHVTIRSSDPEGRGDIGLDLTLAHGPAYFKDITIEGCDIAIKADTDHANLLLEHVKISGQREAGLVNLNAPLQIRDLHSRNRVPVIRNLGRDIGTEGFITVIDSRFEGIGEPELAIENNAGQLFVRNVQTPGYRHAIFDRDDFLSGPDVREYLSHARLMLFANEEGSLDLPVLDTPAVPQPDFSQWADVRDFGAKGDGQTDDTAAIQRAMNSGKRVILFQPGSYVISETIKLGEAVQRVDFLWSHLIPREPLASAEHPQNPMFVVGEGTHDAVFLENAWVAANQSGLFTFVEHATKRDLVLLDLHLHRGAAYRNSVDGGRVFIENVKGKARPRTPGHHCFHFKNQMVWGRNLDPEDGDRLIRNDGGFLWALGIKTEMVGPKVETINGGVTEILGGVVWMNRSNAPSSSKVGDIPMIINRDSHCSISLLEHTQGNPAEQNPHEIVIEEVRDGIRRVLLREDAPQRLWKRFWDLDHFGYGSLVPLYVGYDRDEVRRILETKFRLEWPNRPTDER